MKIITTNVNVAFAQASHQLGAGFVTGPVRIIVAIAQIALNGVALIFSAIPTALGCFKKDSPFHAENLLGDAQMGFLHIQRGIYEFLPGSSFWIDMVPDGRIKTLSDDHPFRGSVVEDWCTKDSCS